ncbi:efflux transporter periplasmic adaptor subunit [Polynucleobacter asymbioticus]|uniref:efflux RND transporter periplasmic adaptor subunit n=1 Tax=Polynucleobacter asymbioticus TaxID=576611 RepID=UPI00090848B6|nr:efflux RND transporter periplasmic adaptor subunit [Polynucleobacter asymbioticus]APC06354.1 efflux transporter periplasmic adaptor subunit [Polynucleobacter asymbioticus]
MKDKITTILKRAYEEAKQLPNRFKARVEANTNEIHRSYWALPPETRARLRLVIVCISILMLGIVIGLFVNVNRPVKLEKSDKSLKVESSGVMELKLPGLNLNPNIYVFSEAVKSDVPVELNMPGRLTFNAEKSKVISARAAGRVERIVAFDGAQVQVGSPVLEMYSPDFISAEQEYLLSSKTTKILEGNKALGDLLSDSRITQDAAANRIRNLGAGDGEIKNLERTGKTQTNLVVRSPIDGVVVKRAVEPGAFANIGDVLATLADPKALWFLGNVYEQDIAKIQKGQTIILRTEAYPDKVFTARANFIAPTIDPDTRALVIRCDVDNPEGLLRPDMFASGKLQVGSSQAVVLPQTAIVRVREMRYVIIKTASDTYKRFAVKGFDLDGKQFAVTEGVEPGMKVLTDGAVLLNDRFAKQEE